MKDTYKKKANELVKKMTLREKIGQVAQKFYGFEAYTRDENGEIVLTEEFKSYVKSYGGLGLLNNYFRADPWCKRNYSTGGILIHEREHAYNVLQKFMVEETRLGIPVLIEEDSPHGRCVLDSVLFPVSFNIGCTFNPDLYVKQAEMIGTESKLGGLHLPYLSCLDMAMDPRWGRTEECFSEDPYLAAKMSAAATKGMRQSGSKFCAKHFAGQGAAEGGHNQCPAVIGERELREIHLPSVKAAVNEGCDCVMAAYNEIDGIPCHANSYLNNTILRDEFGFDGVVRSDASGVDNLRRQFIDPALCAAIGIKSGVDADLWDGAYLHLEEAVERNLITEAEIDAAVERILTMKYELGLMEHPFLEENGQSKAFVSSGVAQQVAYDAAAESLVLMKNNKGILPLEENAKILLIGCNLNDIYCQMGDYTSEQKSPHTIADEFGKHGATFIKGWDFINGIVTNLDELRNAVEQTDVIIYGFGGSSKKEPESIYNSAGTLVKAAAFMDCGEGADLSDLALTEGQNELIKMIADWGKPIISIGLGGRPYIINDIVENSDAVLWCGYPGQEGARAIYDSLLGKSNRFGRLSITFPKQAGQLPMNYNRRGNYNRARDFGYTNIDNHPEFCFGHGLSYSKFIYSDFNIDACNLDELKKGNEIRVEFAVENVSNVAGMAVPQLYIFVCGGTITHRAIELKGFDKVALKPGDKKKIEFKLGQEELQEWSVNKKYEVFPMDVTIMLGESCENIIYEKVIQIR